MQLRFFIIVFIIFISACGSSVSESEKDFGLKDVTLNDVAQLGDLEDETKDGISDTNGADGLQDVKDEITIDEGVSDAVTTDEGVTQDILPDSIQDIEWKDISDRDVSTQDIYEDVVQDSGFVDTGVDGGGDIIEDVGSPYCKLGDKKQYKCDNGDLIDYCVCENTGCKPHCDKIGTDSEGWYDCKGQLIRWADCAKCNVYCGALGTKGEGWYSDCGGLIKWDKCAPDWFCLENPGARCGFPCTDSCDCPEDKPLCINGKCENSPILHCTNDNLCPCGYYCLNGLCKSGMTQCRNSCDCKEGYICVNNVCREKLNNNCSNEPCPCNSYCVKSHLGVDTCQKGCLDNCDCPPYAPICSGGVCLSELIFDCKDDDRNCPCGYRCIYGECVKSNEFCNNSCECKNPLRQVCINEVCTDPVTTCKNDSECPCGLFCEKGYCVSKTQCKSSCDCKSNEICKNGICETYNSGLECKSNLDCPCKHICTNGLCIVGEPIKCQYSCDCPEEMICPSGTCEQYVTYKCTKDTDCLCGQYCNISGIVGYCVTGCNDPCDCPIDAPYCINNNCISGDILPISCKSNKDCKCNETCKDGMCIPF
ncbi:MAG: hypothetical protein N2746_05545 [Deltaproteobacteria bacterium]|nr:hypothetical protein [Deltaproteobacteria bacterium]